MCHPQLLIPGPFSHFCEKLSAEVHPPYMFILILPPQYTPHDFRHARQMAFKTHPNK